MANVELETALSVANKMLQPWKWATAILTLVIVGLIYVILTSETTINNKVLAEAISAHRLESTLNSGVK